jgi:hypothetical protein
MRFYTQVSRTKEKMRRASVHPLARVCLNIGIKSGNVSVGFRTRTEIDRIPWQELP